MLDGLHRAKLLSLIQVSAERAIAVAKAAGFVLGFPLLKDDTVVEWQRPVGTPTAATAAQADAPKTAEADTPGNELDLVADSGTEILLEWPAPGAAVGVAEVGKPFAVAEGSAAVVATNQAMDDTPILSDQTNRAVSATPGPPRTKRKSSVLRMPRFLKTGSKKNTVQ